MALWDAFGFQLGPLCSAEQSARAATQRSQTKAQTLWQGIDIQTSTNSSLKTLIRKGVPLEVRPALWFTLSGGAARKASAAQRHYQQLSTSVINLPDDILFNVEKDVSNIWASFKQHRLYQGSKGREALSRILMALAQHNSGIGYPRGLHHVAALLLVVMGVGREEEVFWTLAALLEDRLFPYCSGQVEFSSKIEQVVLDKLVQKKLPRISKHLAQLEVDLGNFTAGWLSSLFTNALPPETLVRVWDCIISEGSKVMHRVALALLKRHEATILSCTHHEIMKKVLDLRISRSYDADELLSIAFNGIGSLSGSTMGAIRSAALASPPLLRQSGGSSGRSSPQHSSPGASSSPSSPAITHISSSSNASASTSLGGASASTSAAAGKLRPSSSMKVLRPAVGWAEDVKDDSAIGVVKRPAPRRSSR